jgi:hypothetical protein
VKLKVTKQGNTYTLSRSHFCPKQVETSSVRVQNSNANAKELHFIFPLAASPSESASAPQKLYAAFPSNTLRLKLGEY